MELHKLNQKYGHLSLIEVMQKLHDYESSASPAGSTYTLTITGIKTSEEAKGLAEEFAKGSMRWFVKGSEMLAYPSSEQYPTTIRKVR